MPTAPEIAAKRRQAILEILAARPVARQAEFVELLRARGLEATQSSISRDLRELGVAKLGDGYAQLDVGSDPDMQDIPVGFVRGFATAGDNLTVIRTATGAAARVALYLDRSEWPEIVGTVSGDDTIFVATRNGREQRQLLSRLNSLQH